MTSKSSYLANLGRFLSAFRIGRVELKKSNVLLRISSLMRRTAEVIQMRYKKKNKQKFEYKFDISTWMPTFQSREYAILFQKLTYKGYEWPLTFRPRGLFGMYPLFKSPHKLSRDWTPPSPTAGESIPSGHNYEMNCQTVINSTVKKRRRYNKKIITRTINISLCIGWSPYFRWSSCWRLFKREITVGVLGRFTLPLLSSTRLA